MEVSRQQHHRPSAAPSRHNRRPEAEEENLDCQRLSRAAERGWRRLI